MRCKGHNKSWHRADCHMCGRCKDCGAQITGELSMADYGLCPACLRARLEQSRITRVCFRCGHRLRELRVALLACPKCGLLVSR